MIKDGTEYSLKLLDADIKIGSGEKFVPNINMSQWSDECWLNVNHPDVVNTEKETFQNDKVSLEIGDNTHEFYEKDGKLEYDILLKSEPTNKQIIFNLQFPDGLKFHYQPTLEAEYYEKEAVKNLLHRISTVEEYLAISHRPDNVVGSYAAYWNKKNRQYKTGKFCHIFRPKIIGNDLQEYWCDIKIDDITKEMIVTIPDGVVYPAILDPLFGYESQGPSNQQGDWGYVVCTAEEASPATGTATRTKLYSANSDAGMDMKFGIYEDSAGDPYSLLQTETEFANMGTWSAGWKEISPVSYSVNITDVYWHGWCISATLDNYWYDVITDATRYAVLSYATAWDDPYIQDGTDNVEISIYSEWDDVVIEQEGFRFYADGTESGSTPLEDQDVDLTIAKETTFQERVLLNATGDPGAEQFQLEYKETSDGAGEWRKVPT